MAKFLSEKNLAAVRSWLESKGIPHLRPGRTYSNGVLLAELLHQIKPKLVDLHNYPHWNAYEMRLNNWETLNRNCLQRIGLKLNKNELREYAAGDTDTVMCLLYKIMMAERAGSLSKEGSYTAEGVPELESNSENNRAVPYEVYAEAVSSLGRTKDELRNSRNQVELLEDRLIILSDGIEKLHKARRHSRDSRRSSKSRHSLKSETTNEI